MTKNLLFELMHPERGLEEFLQKDEDGNEHPLHFVSRTLKSAELNYNVTDLEGLAAFYCVKKIQTLYMWR